MELRKLTKEELQEILKEHKLWLDTKGKEGKYADLSYADLSYADLSYADLSRANLSGTDLRCAALRHAELYKAILSRADLTGASLRYANLHEANLHAANLHYTILTGANLHGASLHEADLSCADLSRANLYAAILYAAILYAANLHDADLTGANLHGASLYGANLSENEKYRLGTILNEPIIGYKKCRRGIIVKLEIPKGAIVFSINGNKCRTNIAKVLEISGNRKEAISIRDDKFVYKKDKTYKIKDFDLAYNVECSTGIHFFKTKEEAEKY